MKKENDDIFERALYEKDVEAEEVNSETQKVIDLSKQILLFLLYFITIY